MCLLMIIMGQTEMEEMEMEMGRRVEKGDQNNYRRMDKMMKVV